MDYYINDTTGRIFLSVLICLAAFFYCAAPGLAEAIPVPSPEINHQFSLGAGFEDNRTLGGRWELRGIYQLEYNNHYRLQTGLSYNGKTGYINGIFLELGYDNFKDSQYSARLKFLGMQYAQYGIAANSIIPYLNWRNGDYEVDIGLNYRYTHGDADWLWNIFDYNGDVSETILYYRLGWKVPLRDERYALAVEFKNNHEFYAGNLGAYAIFINGSYRINQQVKIYGNLGLWQSGSIALSAVYYKTTLHAGVEVRL